MKNKALLVVDVQTALIENDPYDCNRVIQNIKDLIAVCRNRKVEVIYVCHDGGAGDELEFGTPGWQIFSEIAPLENEKIVKKRFNSAFRQTDLREYLEKKEIKKLILVGLQTEHCVDTTCRIAFEYGYEVVIPNGAFTTYDSEFLTGQKLCEYYGRKIWNGRYAKLLSMAETIEEI